MKYYLGFFKNKNLLNPCAWSIRIAEDKKWSHVEVIEVYDDDMHSATCYGSVFPKSRSIKLKEMLKHYELMKLIPINCKVPPDVAYTILQENLNKPYSFGQILFIGMKIVFFAQWKWFSRIKLNLSKFSVCTEFAGVFMRDACGYELPCSPDMLCLDDCEDLAAEYLVKGAI